MRKRSAAEEVKKESEQEECVKGREGGKQEVGPVSWEE
jgi:hypothetical protein